LFTGFHPKDLELEVVKQGGELADTWGKKVTILVIKDETVVNEKTKKAAAAGIPIMTADQFRSRL
jgi:ABC-type sugar transport system substrate-binding protein